MVLSRAHSFGGEEAGSPKPPVRLPPELGGLLLLSAESSACKKALGESGFCPWASAECEGQSSRPTLLNSWVCLPSRYVEDPSRPARAAADPADHAGPQFLSLTLTLDAAVRVCQ